MGEPLQHLQSLTLSNEHEVIDDIKGILWNLS
jgi:hypothetical protein